MSPVNEQERQFEGIWIPKEIWLSKDLTIQEKIFYVEIKSLDNENGCFATNKYFSDFFGISKTRCSLVISSLIKKNYIASTIIYKEGSKQILKRVLKDCYRPYLIKVKYPIQQKLKDNSTISNTSNSTFYTKEDSAPKVAPLSDPEKTFEELAAKAKKITATQSDVMPDGDEELTQLKSEKPKRKKVAAKKESQPEQKEPSLFTLAKDSFTEWHKKHSPGVEMYWDRKEIGQLAQMIKRLQHEAKASNFVARSDQDFIDKIFDPFCKKYINSKEWFSDSFTPASIVSKWNVIVQALRNPKAKNGTKTPERLKMEREYQPNSEIKVSKVPV